MKHGATNAQVAKTNHKKKKVNTRMMQIMPKSYLRVLVIPMCPMPSAYFVTKFWETIPEYVLSHGARVVNKTIRGIK
jgi:hypothetical protein